MYDWDDDPDLNITPLIDIMLVLMAIFMILAPSIKYQEDITLAEGSQTQMASPENTLSITIDKSLAIVYLNNNQLVDKYQNKEDFNARFSANMDAINNQQVVQLTADASIPYEEVMKVLAILKSKNFTKFALITK